MVISPKSQLFEDDFIPYRLKPGESGLYLQRKQQIIELQRRGLLKIGKPIPEDDDDEKDDPVSLGMRTA